MALKNIQSILFESDLQIDKIIGVFTNTVNIAAPTGAPITVTDSKPHGFGDSCYFQGIFTMDGGVTWNDFGSMTPNLSTPAQPVFQTLDCNATIDSTNCNVIFTNYFDSVHGVGTARTATYKILLIAKNTMAAPLTPLPITRKTYFNSNFNYQKIAFQGTRNFTVPAGSSGQVTIPHNLGYVPKVRAWRFDSGTPTICRPLGQTIDSIQMIVDAFNIAFVTDQSNFASSGINANLEYRVYYDA